MFQIIRCLFVYECCHPTIIENKIWKIYPAFRSCNEQEKCNICAFKKSLIKCNEGWRALTENIMFDLYLLLNLFCEPLLNRW